MTSNAEAILRQHVESIWAVESRRIFATQIRLLGDFDLAEDALHDAFKAAMEQWPRDGLTAEAIAHAFFTSPTTLAQRIVRAKTKIRQARIPHQVSARLSCCPRRKRWGCWR